jgi:hypothetical protein
MNAEGAPTDMRRLAMTIRCPVMLMDAARWYQPHYVSDGTSKSGRLSDTALRDARTATRNARDEYIARLIDVWRWPDKNSGDIENAWERGDVPYSNPRSQNGQQPDNSRRDIAKEPDTELLHGDPGAEMRRHLRTEPGNQAQRERDRVWEDHWNRLSSAWQTGQTDPRRATAIERQERWRGGR